MNIDDIIENIKNKHYRKLIKNIFNKLDDEEIYAILELNNQLQDKINKINKAIEYIKEHNVLAVNKEYLPSGIERCCSAELLEILGDEDEKD